MEPLTTIELGTCKWLGIIALAASAVAELLSLTNGNSRALHSAICESARKRARDKSTTGRRRQ